MGSYYTPPGNLAGAHRSSQLTFVSDTGVNGTAGKVETFALPVIVIPANTLSKVGDRLRLYAYFRASGAGPITAAIKIGPAGSEVTCADLTVTNTNLSLIQCGVLYTQLRRAHIVEEEAGVVGNASVVNSQGFLWNTDQNLLFTQTQVTGQFLTLYALIVDIFPGV